MKRKGADLFADIPAPAHMTIADRALLADANDLIARFGDDAGSEAAQRANRSRALGNFIHFCKWRQVERLIALLLDDSASGTLH